MAYQNINQYNYPKLSFLNKSEIQDFSLASDERNYKEEVIFSNNLIGENDGTRLPFSFDLNSSGSSELYVLNFYDYNFYNNLVSLNYYNPKNEDLSCYTAQTSCDIGLTGIDNGLVNQMTGQTISFTQGLLPNVNKFDRLSFDRRLKLHQVTGFTQSPNSIFSGLSQYMSYNVVSKQDDYIGVYHELYGGFYQGFYKLFSYDYNIFPERVNKGWSVELLLKPRIYDEYILDPQFTTLNNFYPNNKNIFFYLGTRAENKFYHHASGTPQSDTGYTRVTESLTCLKTCACSDTGITNSNCIDVYQPSDEIESHGLNCDCGCNLVPVLTEAPEKDPLYDGLSNAIAFKFCGDNKNPQIGVRVLRFTGDCITTGSCETSGITYQTGYTIDNYCTDKGIYDFCESNVSGFTEQEHWVQLDFVWERNSWYDTCDLWYKGGLGLITKDPYLYSVLNESVLLIEPPVTSSGSTPPQRIEIVQLNERWLQEKEYRQGKLKVYVNGKIFHTFDNIEEIIPRALDTEKERQVGVPFNISWGGGTQGLHDNLTFTGCPDTLTGLTYQQDPECFPNNILSGTTLSGLSTNILIEQNFAGSFDGGISQFRMYTEPLSADEVKHNFLLLKDTFGLLNPDCENCNVCNGYQFNLSDIYDLPTSGNSLFADFINEQASNNPDYIDNYGEIFWNTVDLSGIDRSEYFSGITGDSTIQITLCQDGYVATYTATSCFTSAYFGDNYGTVIYSNENCLGQIIKANVYFNFNQPIYISYSQFVAPPFPSPTPTPSITPTQTVTPTPGASPTQTPTPTVTPTITPTLSPLPNAYAYVFPEPQDSTSLTALATYMYNNGSTSFLGYGNSGVPNTTDYSNNLDLYVHYSGFSGVNSTNFITDVSTLKSLIRQYSGNGVDTYGCGQAQYTFGTIEIKPTQINPTIKYFYSIWIPLSGVGYNMTNMTVDVGMGEACLSNIIVNGIPDATRAGINVTVTSGAVIPAGTYRVLWMPPQLMLPPSVPTYNSIFIKGNLKY
jgi:hypothetical protein